MKRVFLIHGFDGRPDNHWFPWLKAELTARNFKVFSPQLPNAAHPKVLEWFSMIASWVGRTDSDTFFVGHSLGCITIARYLSSLPDGAKIGGAVFVAGFSGNIHIPEIAEFYSLPFNTEKAKNHGGKFTAIFSDNDTDVPLAQAIEFAEELEAKKIIEKGKGHFCADDGVTALPSALEALLSMSN